MSETSKNSEFEAFVERVAARLRVALIAVFGQEGGRDAAATALLFGWEHWERVSGMENPVGYLYRVGRSKDVNVRTPRRRTPLAIAALLHRARG